ncbi:MAG: ADP-ribosylglycohydrolase family protein [Gloeocapsa sp. DLM2.Bin57]|nr:MAG: ADP-ribosylglycohydrolase family protein [Gloeocapsa sp. DLM2.Bin57]
MLYSTLSRFQGAIWGSLNITQSDILSELMIKQTKNLIESGDLNIKQMEGLANLTISQMAVATLPVLLFFHDSPQLLTNKLTAIITKLNQTTETLQELLTWSKAISLALTEQLEPQDLLKQLLQENSQTKLTEQLEQVQSYLEQNLSLNQVVNKLSRLKQPETAIALAIYCFLFTPQDFNLAINRAKQSKYQPEITQALTGALTGVYNGYHNIPLQLRLSLQQNHQQRISITIASQLYASWCGITPTGLANWQQTSQTIAQPGLIQPRKQLKIISQQQTW